MRLIVFKDRSRENDGDAEENDFWDGDNDPKTYCYRTWSEWEFYQSKLAKLANNGNFMCIGAGIDTFITGD